MDNVHNCNSWRKYICSVFVCGLESQMLRIRRIKARDYKHIYIWEK
jgi:hypothetical protein